MAPHHRREEAHPLTIDEKKRILLNNIHGVDIDSQAVEVTKLALLLKVLEGESEASITRQLALIQARALPDLDDNIKCGNSLIGPDFYDSEQMSFLDEEEHYRINVLDWRAEFPQVFEGDDPGFDAVIGNPPYVRIQALKEFAPVEVEHYKTAYRSAGKGNYDIYVVFVERGLDLLNKNGRLGYILPHKFFNAKYGGPVRDLISSGNHLSKVVHFGDEQVFRRATTYTCLMFLDQTGNAGFRFEKVADLTEWRATGASIEGAVSAASATADDWNFVVGAGAALFERLRQMPVKLGDVANRMAQGIRTSANEVYVLDLISENGDLLKVRSKQLGRDVELEREAVSLFLQGREIKPFRTAASGKVVIVPYSMRGGRAHLIPQREYEAKFPRTFRYLSENKTYLENRERGRMRGDNWHAYIYPKNIEVMAASKILVPDIADRASFALDEAGEYTLTSGYGITFKDEMNEAQKYVLGLLNSRVLDSYLKSISTTLRGGFFRYFTQYIEQLPIRTIDFSDAEDAVRHERMVGLVERMLSLHERLAGAGISREKTVIGHQIAATDRQIDRLVYDLYGLTEDEIQIVEGIR